MSLKSLAVLGCIAACWSCADGYMVFKMFTNGDCSGEPTMVKAQTTEVASMTQFGTPGECTNLPEEQAGGPHRGGGGGGGVMAKSLQFNIEEDGAKCSVDIYPDADCSGAKQTKQIWDGACEQPQMPMMGGGGGGMKDPRQGGGRGRGGVTGMPMGGGSGGGFGAGSISIMHECTTKLPEKVDWNMTCLSKDMILKASEKMKKIKSEGLQGVCFGSCLTDTEFFSSKDKFDEAFKSGCAKTCDAADKEIVFAGGIIHQKFDCNFKVAQMPAPGGPAVGPRGGRGAPSTVTV